MKIDNWEDLIVLAKEQGLTPKEAWERIEKTNLKFLNRKSSAEKELKKGTRVQRLMFPKNNEENIEPGKILAENMKGPIIKTGDNAIQLIEIDPEMELLPGSYL